MWPISNTYQKELLAENARLGTSAQVYDKENLILPSIPVTSAKVTIDANAAVRRRATLTVVDPDGTLTPTLATDVLSPYGYSIQLSHGYEAGDESELVPVGRFRISAVKFSANSPTIQVTAQDRALSVSRTRFESPYVVASGTNHVTAIETILNWSMPGITFIKPNKTFPYTTGVLMYEDGGDPWDAVQSIAESIGCDLCFDQLGRCVLSDRNDAKSVVHEYVVGSDNTTLLSLDTEITVDSVYNAVVVTGEPQDLPPVRSVAYDLDPSSPTYYGGRFGKVPKFYSSPLVRTQAQADQTAATMLTKARRTTSQSLSLSVTPHPALDVLDLVRVRSDDLDIDDLFEVTNIELSCDGEPMTMTVAKVV